MAAGISAGSVWFTLQDLRRNIGHLPEGELRDAWLEAYASMQLALDEAMEIHRKVTGRSHGGVPPGASQPDEDR